MDFIRESYPIARKEHQCDYCCGKILIGTNYCNQVLKYDYLYEWKSHLRCEAIVGKLNMHDNCDEGVTSDDFYEYINEAYMAILGEDSEPAKFTFHDRLDVVCNHFNI